MGSEKGLAIDLKTNLFLNKCLYSIRHKRIKPTTKGSYSYCYVFNDYVILKNISKFDVADDKYEQNFNEQKEFINNLVDTYNISTPRLISCFTGKHHFYLFEECAKGKVLSVFYPSTARAITYKTNSVLDSFNTEEELRKESDIQPYEEKAIGKGMFDYNNQMQKQLKEAGQHLFDKFVRDFKLLIENGACIDCARSENFLFDKNKGFAFVDLEKNKTSQQSQISDFGIAKMIYNAFADFKTYIKYMDENQVKIIIKNMDAVNAKLYQAIKNNKFELSQQEDEFLKSSTKMSASYLKGLKGKK